MYHCQENRLIDATRLHEVVAWADSTARPDRTCTLCIEQHHDGRPGLLKFAGVDPTESHQSETPQASE